MEILIGARTDRGRHRQRNEDRVLACATQDRAGPLLCLVAVADGMGGSPGGEQASEIAIKTLEAAFHPVMRQDPASGLRSMFQQANSEIYRLAGSDPGYRGMGSTLVAALVARDGLWVANVGDSRAYLIRNGSIRQLTHDHSWVAEQVKAGQISKSEAAQSVRRNVVTRSLGMADTVEVDTFTCGAMGSGDVLLLCSDGLYNMVSNADIASVATLFSPQEAVDRLVELANNRGGKDNIAVVVARWAASPSRRMKSSPETTGRVL